MGACRSKLSQQDKQLALAAEFVRYASQGDLAGLQLMLKKRRVHVDAQDRFGMTALHWAAYAGKLVCVQELIKTGASAEIVDANKRNALHHACRKDHDDVVRFLLESAKMDINASSESKDTPLHKAVRGKCVKTVVVLLKYGADPSRRNDQNRTPLEELDAAIATVTDQVPTARVDAEFTAWHQPPQDSNSRNLFVAFKRRGSGGGVLPSKRSGRRASASTIIEKTLVRRFLSRRSSLSEFSDSGSSSRGSITGMWATNAEDMQTRTATVGSSSPINPLNLAALRAANPRIAIAGTLSTSSSMSSISSVTVEPHPASVHEVGGSSQVMLRQKSLKYAGKRVIMALRVKKTLPGDAKRQMIRLLLERHTSIGAILASPQGQQQTNGQARRNSLSHQASDFKLSLLPDM